MGRHTSFPSAVTSRLRSIIALLAATTMVLAMAVIGGVGVGTANAALPDGVTSVTWLINAKPVAQQESYELEGEILPVVSDGDTVGVHFAFTNQAAGTSITFTFAGVEIPASIPTPGGGQIESIVPGTGAGEVVVTFADSFGGTSNEAQFDLKLDHSGSSGKTDIGWNLAGEGDTLSILRLKSGDEIFEPGTSIDKFVTGNVVTEGVTIDDTATAGTEVTISAGTSGIQTATITYDLVLAIDGPTDLPFTFSDELPLGLVYDTTSFQAKVTTWDEHGLNKTEGTFSSFDVSSSLSGDGHTNAHKITDYAYTGVSSTGPARLEINYTAHVSDNATYLDGLKQALQTAYDDKNGASGSIEVEIGENTASFQSESASADAVVVRATTKGKPGIKSGNFTKHAAGWTSGLLHVDEDGRLTPARPVQFRFGIDWTYWGTHGDDKNIVIDDTLPEGINWDTTSTVTTPMGVRDVSPVTPTTCQPADVNPGQYCIDTDSRRLVINIGAVNDSGNDTSAARTITVDAVVTQVDTDTGVTDSDTKITSYTLTNVATFTVGTGYSTTRQRAIQVKVRGDGVAKDKNAFKKEGGPRDGGKVNPGGTAIFDYTFTVTAGQDIDARNSKIVDYLSVITGHDGAPIFDLGANQNDSALAAVDVTGTYDGQSLDRSHFTLSTDTVGDLTIELSPLGKAIVDAQGPDKKWVVTISLETRPFTGPDGGKETVAVSNRASLFGGTEERFEDSTQEVRATSYANDLEVAKSIYQCDGDGQRWAGTIDAPADLDGALHQDTYLYRLELIPHGTYGSTGLIDSNDINIDDVLPAELTFIDFVDGDDITDCETYGTVAVPSVGGNLTSTQSGNVVNVTVQSGKKFQSGAGPYAVYFAASVQPDRVDPSDPIVNTFGSSAATIVPELSTPPSPPGGGGITPPEPTDPGPQEPTETTPVDPTPTSPPTTSPDRSTTTAPATVTTVASDQCVDIVETGFEPGETVTVKVTGDHTAYQMQATADADGTVVICLEDGPGTYTIEVFGENQQTVREVTIAADTIASTGVATWPMITLALLLLGAGAALLGIQRRGRHQ